MFYFLQAGGDVCPLTLSGKLFQVLQCDLFVPRAVCQAVVDHSVLKGNKHSLVIDTQSGKKGTSRTWAAAQRCVFRLDPVLSVATQIPQESFFYCNNRTLKR